MSVPTFSAGSTFADRYQIIEELGKGGMGVVYKVLDKVINERIVLKILRRDISEDEKMIERFTNELKLARKISHKNVCRLFDIGQEKGLFYITMEFVQGEDLKTTLDRVGPLSVGKALKILKQVCRGLAEAHRLGVIHRDLKPQNMIIGREGEVRILDFGIARSAATRGITETGMTIGTPEYMSPEQAMGEDLDPRSDVYSLGVVMFEMLTDTLPFRGETAVAIALKKKEYPPPNPRSLNPQIPPDLNALIIRCLERDKHHRPGSAEEVLEEIERIEKNVPTTESVVAAKTTKSFRTGGRKYILIPAAALAVIAAFAAAYFLFIKPHPAPSKIGTLEAATTPAEAKIDIDGQDSGSATGKWELEAGTHEVRIQAPRHQGKVDQIQIEARKTTRKEYALVPFYYLVVKSKPDKASVYVDGTLMGTTPTDPIELTKNSCILRIVKGNNVLEKTVPLDPEQVNTVEWILGQPVVADNTAKRGGDRAEGTGGTADASKGTGGTGAGQTGQGGQGERQTTTTTTTTTTVKDQDTVVPTVSLIDLPSELIQEFRERTSRINATGSPDVRVGGQIELTLTVRENGRIEVVSFDDSAFEVIPSDKKEGMTSAIWDAVQAVVLTAPRDKAGRSVRVKGWRIGYSVSRYQNRIILNVLT